MSLYFAHTCPSHRPSCCSPLSPQSKSLHFLAYTHQVNPWEDNGTLSFSPVPTPTALSCWAFDISFNPETRVHLFQSGWVRFHTPQTALSWQNHMAVGSFILLSSLWGHSQRPKEICHKATSHCVRGKTHGSGDQSLAWKDTPFLFPISVVKTSYTT